MILRGGNIQDTEVEYKKISEYSYFNDGRQEIVKKLEQMYLKFQKESKKTEIEPFPIRDGKADIIQGMINHRCSGYLDSLRTLSEYGILASEWFGKIESEREGTFCSFVSRIHQEDGLDERRQNRARILNLQRLKSIGNEIVLFFDTTNPIMQQLLHLDYFEFVKNKQQNPEKLTEIYSEEEIEMFEQIIEPFSPASKNYHIKDMLPYCDWSAIPGGIPSELVNGICIKKIDYSKEDIDEIARLFPNATIFNGELEIIHIPEKQETRLEDVFTEDEVSNYDLFIEKLKQLKQNGHTTKDILDLVCEYYKKYVSYNYDQLQIVKIQNALVRHPEIADVMKKYPDDAITPENAEQIKQQYISDLNSVFMQLEGRTLTPRTIERLFSGFGTVIHHPARDFELFGKQKHKDSYDEIKGINTGDFPSRYCNGMLQEGVCAEYAKVFEKRICEDLGIKHISVEGAGTTGHAWSLIYLPEEQRWAHFDMTMVKFYQDGWIKDHSPYTEKDWIAATTEDIFKMQSTRKIHSINRKSCFCDRNNYGDLETILAEESQDIDILGSAIEATETTTIGGIREQGQQIQSVINEKNTALDGKNKTNDEI